jgi:RHS repeat-associated protein
VATKVRNQFTGYERDHETSLDFAQARYYNSSLGRFFVADPIFGAPYTPATFNRYQYGLGNPLRFVDATGGYDEDVHRDLTEVLALAAGFSARHARGIANATQWPDDSRSGVQPEQTGKEGEEARAKYHFTDEATRWAHWQNFSDLVKEGNLEAFSGLGTFLHAQQDSFSHEGFGYKYGQLPAAFENLSIFSSPKSAEGEARKYDRTSFNPSKAERMARDTLGRLIMATNMMAATDRFGSFGKPVSFDHFETQFKEWAKTNDPKEKARLIKQIRLIIIRVQSEQESPPNRTKKYKTRVRIVNE